MEYKTKFALGDVVYYGNGKELHKGIVKEIRLHIGDKKRVEVIYDIDCRVSLDESCCMTREEAIKCL